MAPVSPVGLPSQQTFRSLRRHAAKQKQESTILRLKLELASAEKKLTEWWQWWYYSGVTSAYTAPTWSGHDQAQAVLTELTGPAPKVHVELAVESPMQSCVQRCDDEVDELLEYISVGPGCPPRTASPPGTAGRGPVGNSGAGDDSGPSDDAGEDVVAIATLADIVECCADRLDTTCASFLDEYLLEAALCQPTVVDTVPRDLGAGYAQDMPQQENTFTQISINPLRRQDYDNMAAALMDFFPGVSAWRAAVESKMKQAADELWTRSQVYDFWEERVRAGDDDDDDDDVHRAMALADICSDVVYAPIVHMQELGQADRYNPGLPASMWPPFVESEHALFIEAAALVDAMTTEAIEAYLQDFMEELTNLPVQASGGAFQWSVRERARNLKLAYMLALINFRRM